MIQKNFLNALTTRMNNTLLINNLEDGIVVLIHLGTVVEERRV